MLTQPSGPSFWRSPLPWIAAVQLIAAYEWLISGLNKLLAGNFPQALRGVLTGAMHDNPHGLENGLLQSLVLPCCSTFGAMIECGEVLVGLALLGAVALWLLGDRVPAWLHGLGAWSAVVACLAAAFMNVNFYIAMGGALPLLSPADAANEGVSIDVVLMLVMLALAGANLALQPSKLRAEPVPSYTRA